MSINSAMQNGVSGLKANMTAVVNVSSNIANANTDGYRRSFAQMVSSTVGSTVSASAPPGGVRAVQASEIDSDGQLRSTSNANDLAISGAGFFVVSKNPNDPSLSNYMLTRAGSFRPDENGDLRNAAGFYLSGFPYDTNGNLLATDRNSFSGLSTINVGSQTVPGEATSEMGITGNLPSQQTGAAAGAPFVSSASVFDPLGATQRLQFSWAPQATQNEWQLSIADEGGAPLGSVTVTFSDTGATPGAPAAYTGLTGLTSAGATPDDGLFDVDIGAGQIVTLDFGAVGSYGGLTQFAGDYSPLDVVANGSSSGTLTRTEVTDNGDVFGVFDNGMRRPIYSIPLAMVPNPNGLIETNGNSYSLSSESGPLELSTASAGPTGTITSGALETSNVDIAEELTDLIQIQRAYSSNAKVVTTADEILDETMRIKR
jgi:flagellar hook protein FlgE